MRKLIIFLVTFIFSFYLLGSKDIENTKLFTNSIGIEMVLIEPGIYQMGAINPTPESLDGPPYLPHGNYDEQPVHNVKISKPFYMSVTEITIEQFKEFKDDYEDSEEYSPYVSGISWYDADAFCEWLSKKEGKPYRLPTEAEWEYACRAGSKSLYYTGDTVPKHNTSNKWGLKNMHTDVREWCYDWYGEYPLGEQVDPIGPECGFTKVVRGGGLDTDNPFYVRSANRTSMAPSFGSYSIDPKVHTSAELEMIKPGKGHHPIGFRIVQAPMPLSKPWSYKAPFVSQCIKQNIEISKKGPDPEEPYFRKRYLLPIPPDNSSREEIDAAGLHPLFRGHNHSPGLVVCPNGDVLMIIYTSYREYEPGVSLIASRLRFGTDEWDMPSPLFDFVDVNDHAPMLWSDNGTIYFFWGNPRLESAFPFQWTSSEDNGVTWNEVKFPEFKGEVGSHSRQPINSAFRAIDGTIYVASDGKGPESVLWASTDNGKTWYDAEGRTYGRHTTFVPLRDGSILGMGGKNTDIDGYMPKSISKDGGKTWDASKTPFCTLGSNQRPSIIRLASGRLFFVSDFQRTADCFQPEGIKEKGAFIALSEDEGETWIIRKLFGAQPHETRECDYPTVGYSVANQTPNGLIHVITTMNRPCLHFVFNEAWILKIDNKEKEFSDAELMKSSAKRISNVKEYIEKYPDGNIKVKYSGGIADNGRWLLHGTETWYYKNGDKKYEVNYNLGKRVGEETYWTPKGIKIWNWEHLENGKSIWNQYWSNGNKKAKSTWHNGECEGVAKIWDPIGKLISEERFVDGEIK